MLFNNNILNKPIACNDRLLADIPTMKYGKVDEQTVVFDATFHCSQALKKEFQHKQFMVSCRSWIESLAKDSGIQTSRLFFTNTDGHILISSELAMIYLMWVDEDMLVYLNSIMNDALTDGIALSDGFIVSIIHSKVPNRVLQSIIESRSDEKGEGYKA